MRRNPSTSARPPCHTDDRRTVGTFLQYPDYVIGLFDYRTDQTRVMVSKDYTTGYTHYHNYVGGHWVPTPAYSGSRQQQSRTAAVAAASEGEQCSTI